jgi:hypothetical protein
MGREVVRTPLRRKMKRVIVEKRIMGRWLEDGWKIKTSFEWVIDWCR